VAPDFGSVVDVPLVLFPFGLRNQLDVHLPGREVSSLDGLIQILGCTVRVVPSCGLSLGKCEILDPLISFKGVLDEENFSLIIDPLVCKCCHYSRACDDSLGECLGQCT
jgi:hypothetical protein